jgi:hypothetical protein
MVIATVLERNKELKFHVTIKLDEVKSLSLFLHGRDVTDYCQNIL